MSKFLAQLDELNYPSKIARKLPDGEDASLWIELAVPGHLDSDFALHFDKYLVNPDTKAVTPRPDAPTGVTNDDLLAQYEAAIKEIKDLKADNTAKDATIDQLKTDLATANSNIDLTNQALMEIASTTLPTTDTSTDTTTADAPASTTADTTTNTTADVADKTADATTDATTNGDDK